MPAPPSPPLDTAHDECADPYHYRLIARALDLIDATENRHASLKDLASEVGLSEAHFQRVFSAWAGVSPKRYQQARLLQSARPALASGKPLLEVTLDLGLSAPSRLHDLTVAWEAMTPGEFAAGGATTIRVGQFDTPLGPMIAAATQRGLCGLAFITTTSEAARYDLIRRWPAANILEDAEKIRPWVDAAFRSAAPLAPIGGPFQIKVWEALLNIPEGHTTTYSALAQTVGAPKAARAIGNAVGANPLAILIPCHRVLRKSGELGGYHWGIDRKRRLLALEKARQEVMRDNLPQSHE
jgi:AraC family transcriptional regulator of adaptative response/methylated-DNA-[protein]-cysteine methyltransferase